MKKIITLSFIVLTFSAFSQNQLPNIGFESWTTQTLFENPDFWGSSNYAEYPVTNCQKSTDAQHLSYSALLQTTIFGSDTVFAYVYLGMIGGSGPEGGIPYSTACNQLKGSYKYNLVAGDTAAAIVIKFSGGSMVSMDMIPITGTQNTWTAFTFSINPAAQDSIFVGFISSIPDSYPSIAMPGSYLMVDNISLSHSVNGPGPALPNYSFENWSTVSSTNVDGWTSFNTLLAPYGLTAVSSTSDAFAGSLAAQVETIGAFGDTLPGMLIYGNMDQYGNLDYTPFTGTPTSLTGNYKYSPSGTDDAFVTFEFFQGGSSIGGNMQVFAAGSVYSSFNIPANLSGTPDSAYVIFSSGDNPGSILKLDNVQFTGGNTGVIETEQFTFNIYPNPVSEVLFVQTAVKEDNLFVEIQDMQGRVVLMENFHSTGKAEIDITSLSPGIYMISINNTINEIARPFSVMR